MSDYYINIDHSVIDNGGCVIHNEYGTQTSSDFELLTEIKQIATSIEETEPIIAKALEELQHAIKEQNKPKISNLVKELSTGTVASFIASIASAPLLRFLGL